MDREFKGYGIRFRYPSTWQLTEERQDAERCVSLTLNSPDTSFWSLTLFFSRPRAQRVLESALEAFRQEYDECDFYPARSNLCRRENIARDVDFFCLELLNSAYLRGFETERFTALVLYQGTEIDLNETRGVLEAICTSLNCDAADPGEIP